MADDITLYSSLNNPPPYLRGAGNTVLGLDIVPIITQDDIVRGSIIRYFARQSNLPNGDIIEINETQYNKIKKAPLYSTVQVPWRITGPLDDVLPTSLDNSPTRLYTGVITANKLSAKLADEELPGVAQKLPNPLQFYQRK